MTDRRVRRMSEVASRVQELDEEIDKLTSLASEAARNQDFHVGVRFGVNNNIDGTEPNKGNGRSAMAWPPMVPPRGEKPKYSRRVDIDLRSVTALKVFQGFLDALKEERQKLMEELDNTAE